MKLLIAIASYKVTDLTIDCLRSLSPEIARIPETKVAVCENGSGGTAADELRHAIQDNQWESWVDLIEVYPNRGFTGGTNAAMRPALESDSPPEYVLLLNADTLVTPNALSVLVEFMDRNPRAGIAGTLLMSNEGHVQSSPFRFPGIASEFDRGMRLGLVSKLLSPWSVVMKTPPSPRKVDWVSGASLILRRSLLEEIGLLDEELFTYFDDIDICFRARLAGWETWYVPESKIIHLEGASTGVATRIQKRRLPSYWHQARRRFYLKSYGPLYTALVDAAFIFGYALWRLRRWLTRKPDTDPPCLLLDSIHHSIFLTGAKLTAVENPALQALAPQ
jgi:GT2 family glycosyltransferase